MAQDKETFVARWSRRKLQEQKDLPEKKEESPPPVLPPLDQLTHESDFADFMHPKVEDALRRAALKKLFSDPRFNVPDPFEAYSGDWTGGEPIPEEMLKTLAQARTLLFPEDEKKQEQPKEDLAEKLPQADEPGRKDA
jgi:hypothetical protein